MWGFHSWNHHSMNFNIIEKVEVLSDYSMPDAGLEPATVRTPQVRHYSLVLYKMLYIRFAVVVVVIEFKKVSEHFPINESLFF